MPAQKRSIRAGSSPVSSATSFRVRGGRSSANSPSMKPYASRPCFPASRICLRVCPRSRIRATMRACETAAGGQLARALQVGDHAAVGPALQRRGGHAHALRSLLESEGLLGIHCQVCP